MSYNMLCIEDPSNTTFSGSDANHNSRVNDTTGSFTVREKPAAVPEEPAATELAPPNWWLVNTLIATGLVTAALVTLLIRKRQRRGGWPTGLGRGDWRF